MLLTSQRFSEDVTATLIIVNNAITFYDSNMTVHVLKIQNGWLTHGCLALVETWNLRELEWLYCSGDVVKWWKDRPDVMCWLKRRRHRRRTQTASNTRQLGARWMTSALMNLLDDGWWSSGRGGGTTGGNSGGQREWGRTTRRSQASNAFIYWG